MARMKNKNPLIKGRTNQFVEAGVEYTPLNPVQTGLPMTIWIGRKMKPTKSNETNKRSKDRRSVK